VDAKIRRSVVGFAFITAIAFAELSAGWEASVFESSDGCTGHTTGVLRRHVLGLQSLAALVDLTEALDENMGFDVSSVGDMASASGTIDLAVAVLLDLHAGVLALLVESAVGVASTVAAPGRRGVSVLKTVLHVPKTVHHVRTSEAAQLVGANHVGFKFFNGLSGFDHGEELGLDFHALIICDAHLGFGILADLAGCDSGHKEGKHD